MTEERKQELRQLLNEAMKSLIIQHRYGHLSMSSTARNQTAPTGLPNSGHLFCLASLHLCAFAFLFSDNGLCGFTNFQFSSTTSKP